MNLTMDDVSGVSKDRQRIGSSLADIDPMNIDSTVSPLKLSLRRNLVLVSRIDIQSTLHKLSPLGVKKKL